MPLRDFAILILICAAWAMNSIVTKVVVSTGDIPPLFFAAGRFLVVLAVVFPWLRPVPRPLGRVLLVGVLMGAGVFGLVVVAMKTASPSSVAVVSQLAVPMTAILAYAMLGERLGARRILGTVLAFAGAIQIMGSPGQFALAGGLMFALASAGCAALGPILMKRITDVRPLQFQAWVAVSSLPVMAVSSLLLETGQDAAFSPHGAGYFLGGILFNGLVVSVGAHTSFYWLLRRHDASVLAPLTLMMPLMTIALGVWITHDVFDGRMLLGALATLLGVLIIAVRPEQAMALLGRSRMRS